jgi:hypothetical protein
MQSIRTERGLAGLLLLGFIIGPLVSGCGSSKDNKVVIPEVSPADQSKDSMDFYRSKIPGKAAKK